MIDTGTVLPSTKTSVLDHTLTVNQIVLRYPNALEILHRLGLDTCCGGTLALEEAVAHHGIDLAEVISALSAAQDDIK